MSQFHYLTDEEINAATSGSSQTLRACLLDTSSKYLVLAIPESSPILEPATLALMVRFLAEVGMRPKVYKDSDSQSVQIFLSFSEPVKTAEMAECISNYLATRGFTQTASKLIIHSTEVPFAVPLQPGFSWLNDDLEIKLSRDSISIAAATAMFLHDLDSAAACPATVLERLKEISTPAPSVQIEPTFIESICELASDSNPGSIQNSLKQAVEEESAADMPLACVAELETEVELVTFKPDAVEVAPDKISIVGSEEGVQLLLFPTIANGISALPKGRPKREKRARSNLPDSSETSNAEPNQFLSTPLLAELADLIQTKEVTTNTS